MDYSSLASITACNGNQAGAGASASAGEDSIVKLVRYRPADQSSLLSSSSFQSLLFSSSSMPYHTENSSPASSPFSSSLDQFNGIPFAWEQSPGIPKDNPILKDPSSMMVSSLPLPPLTAINSIPINVDVIIRKQTTSRDRSKNSTTTNDPFVAALVKCSTTDDHRHWNHHHHHVDNHHRKSSRVISRTLGDRFGFVDLSMSCIRSCDVLESNVLVPKSTRMLNGSRSS